MEVKLMMMMILMIMICYLLVIYCCLLKADVLALALLSFQLKDCDEFSSLSQFSGVLLELQYYCQVRKAVYLVYLVSTRAPVHCGWRKTKIIEKFIEILLVSVARDFVV